MTWDEWEKEYPARLVEKLPNLADGPYPSRCEAEGVKENLELANETSFEVIIYKEKFYVVGSE